MPVAGGPFIQKSGILLEVDAANPASYPGTGTAWNNLFNPRQYNGTLTGSITYNTTDAYGALVFPGNNSYVDFGNIGDLSVSWSFQVAVKPAPSASGNYTILSYASGSGTGSLTFKLDYSSSNQIATLSSYSTTGSTQIVYKVSGSVSTGSWSIINASYGSQILGMYVNGIPVDYALTTGSSVGYSGNNRLYIGGTYGVTSSYYSGSIASYFSYNLDVPNTRLVQNYNAYATRFGLRPSNLAPVTVDVDAFRFIDIANITNPTQAAAISSLVIGLKATNLWNKMQVIYPFVGGTAFSHKFNLKNPIPTNAAFQATFNGALIHNAYGVGSGSIGAGYIETSFLDTRDFVNISSSAHVSIYGTVGNGAIGFMQPIWNHANGAFNNDGGINFQPSNFQTYGSVARIFGNSNMTVSTTTGLGMNIISRDSATSNAFYYKTPSVDFNSTSAAAFSKAGDSGNIKFLGGTFTNTTTMLALGFASIGTGLSSTDAANLYTLVQAYQTTLGRQVS